MHAEGKIRTQNIIAQKPRVFRLFNGDFQAVYRNRIFRAHVEIAVLRADGVARNHHTFDYGKRIAL